MVMALKQIILIFSLLVLAFFTHSKTKFDLTQQETNIQFRQDDYQDYKYLELAIQNEVNYCQTIYNRSSAKYLKQKQHQKQSQSNQIVQCLKKENEQITNKKELIEKQNLLLKTQILNLEQTNQKFVKQISQFKNTANISEGQIKKYQSDANTTQQKLLDKITTIQQDNKRLEQQKKEYYENTQIYLKQKQAFINEYLQKYNMSSNIVDEIISADIKSFQLALEIDKKLIQMFIDKLNNRQLSFNKSIDDQQQKYGDQQQKYGALVLNITNNVLLNLDSKDQNAKIQNSLQGKLKQIQSLSKISFQDLESTIFEINGMLIQQIKQNNINGAKCRKLLSQTNTQFDKYVNQTGQALKSLHKSDRNKTRKSQ